MTPRASGDQLRGWVRVLAGALIVLGALWVAGARTAIAPADDGTDGWTTFVEIGDALAAGAEPPSLHTGLSARAAYLLAFHHAQDAADLGRILIAAARLERLGEHELAQHARRAARTLTEEVASRR